MEIENKNVFVGISNSSLIGMGPAKASSYDAHMIMDKLHTVTYGKSLSQDYMVIYRDFFEGDYIVLNKEKNDTMFSIRAKLIKFYRKHKIKFTPSKLNKDVQELMTKKKILIWVGVFNG